MPKTHDHQMPSAPSLLDRKAVGGLESWSGIGAQLRFTLAAIAHWLDQPGFRAFAPERSEDVDVFFEDRTEHYQCKLGPQTPSDVRGYVRDFRQRNLVALAKGAVRRFIIVTPAPNEQVRGAFQALARFRNTHFETSAPEEATTRDDLKSRFVDPGIVDERDFDFLLEAVDLRADWGGLELGRAPWSRIGASLGSLRELESMNVPELVVAAQALAHALEQRKRHTWKREEVVALLLDAVDRYRAGPPTAAGDVVVFEHQSRAPVRTHPDSSALPERLRSARMLRFTVTHPDLLEPREWSALPNELASLFVDGSPFQQVLAHARTSPVLYYGFPHIPFAALVGHRLGEQADVHGVEHDRETGAFAWPANAPASTPPLRVTVNRRGGRGAVVVRIGLSAIVNPGVCRHHEGDSVMAEVDFAVDTPARGIIKSATQAREYARVIRETLDPLVSGNPQVTSVHVFAAVPVSVALLIGQIASSTGFPAAFVYNFREGDEPPYHWAILLQRAHLPEGLVLPVFPERVDRSNRGS